MAHRHRMPRARHHPTCIAGYRAFLQLNRCARKGERAIRILAPVAVKHRDEHGELTGEQHVFFRTIPVFDTLSRAASARGTGPCATGADRPESRRGSSSGEVGRSHLSGSMPMRPAGVEISSLDETLREVRACDSGDVVAVWRRRRWPRALPQKRMSQAAQPRRRRAAWCPDLARVVGWSRGTDARSPLRWGSARNGMPARPAWLLQPVPGSPLEAAASDDDCRPGRRYVVQRKPTASGRGASGLAGSWPVGSSSL